MTIDLSAVSSSPPLHSSDIRIRRTSLHRAHVYKHAPRIRTNGMKRIYVSFLAHVWKPYTPSCIATCAEHAHLVWCACRSLSRTRMRSMHALRLTRPHIAAHHVTCVRPCTCVWLLMMHVWSLKRSSRRSPTPYPLDCPLK